MLKLVLYDQLEPQLKPELELVIEDKTGFTSAG